MHAVEATELIALDVFNSGLTTSDYIAMLAFALSVVALLSNLILTWLKWPRIAVEVSARYRIVGFVTGEVVVEHRPERFRSPGLEVTFAPRVQAHPEGEAVIAGSAEPPESPPPADEALPQIRGEAETPGNTFVLTVINNGSDAITIRSIGFEGTDANGGPLWLDYLETWLSPNEGPLPKVRGGGGLEDAVLPARIEGHDCLIYEYSEDCLAALPGGIYKGYAERYKSFAGGRSGTGRLCARRCRS